MKNNFTTEDAKVHRGQSLLTSVHLYVLCGKIFLILSILFVSFLPASAFCQVSISNNPDEAQSNKPNFIHTPPKSADLPYPGSSMSLLVDLTGTKDSERPLRVLMVRDGKYIDLSVPTARFNEQDQVTYTIQTTAPLAELQYQFLLYNADGSQLLSPRYAVRRKCLPKIETDLAPLDNDLPSDQKLNALVVRAKQLEREIDGFERAGQLIDELKAMLRSK